MPETKTHDEQVHHIYQTLCNINNEQPRELMTAIKDIPTQYVFNVLAEAIRANSTERK